MTLAVEPESTFGGEEVVDLEDATVVTEDGSRRLTMPRRHFRL